MKRKFNFTLIMLVHHKLEHHFLFSTVKVCENVRHSCKKYHMCPARLVLEQKCENPR